MCAKLYIGLFVFKKKKMKQMHARMANRAECLYISSVKFPGISYKTLNGVIIKVEFTLYGLNCTRDDTE